MGFILDGEKIDMEDFSGASIYLDACFILTFLDKSDNRRSEVARILGIWSEFDDVILGLSNHTVTEVINRIFQMRVLGALEVFHENNKLLNQTKDGYNKLTSIQKEKLFDLDAARYLYGLAKRESILKLYKKDINVNISDLIKLAKKDEARRNKLNLFYKSAVETFESFVHSMRMDLGFKVEFLASQSDPHYDIAKATMRIMQLDITDAFHLAIAQSNEYDFLVTLDGDFVHSFYQNADSATTRIIKVA